MKIFSYEKFKQDNGHLPEPNWAMLCDGQEVVDGRVRGKNGYIYFSCRKYEIELKEEGQMFKVEDIKVGMVIEVEYEGERKLSIITVNRDDVVCMSGGYWSTLSCFDGDLRHDNAVSIEKVYGRVHSSHAHEISTKNRELLWERSNTKEMTVAEIEAALGHKVKIIK